LFSYEGRNAHRFYEPDQPNLVTSQREYELTELIKVYKALQPNYVLEIGTQEGGTLYQWLPHAPAGAKVVNIDILQDKDESLVERWHSWRRDDMELISIIEYSQYALHRVEAELPWIDFLFIDGDHSYEGAKLDFELYGPMVRKGGVIAFHDLMTPKSGKQNHIQVGKLWREIQHAGYTTREIWAEQDPDWGGIGVVYVRTQAQRHTGSDQQRAVQAFRPLWKSGRVSAVRQEETVRGA